MGNAFIVTVPTCETGPGRGSPDDARRPDRRAPHRWVQTSQTAETSFPRCHSADTNACQAVGCDWNLRAEYRLFEGRLTSQEGGHLSLVGTQQWKPARSGKPGSRAGSKTVKVRSETGCHSATPDF